MQQQINILTRLFVSDRSRSEMPCYNYSFPRPRIVKLLLYSTTYKRYLTSQIMHRGSKSAWSFESKSLSWMDASNEVHNFASPDTSLASTVGKHGNTNDLIMPGQTRELIKIMILCPCLSKPDVPINVYAAGARPPVAITQNHH